MFVVVAKHVESLRENPGIWFITVLRLGLAVLAEAGPYESGFIVFEEATGSSLVAEHCDFGVGYVLCSA